MLNIQNVLKRNYLFEIKGAINEFVLVDAANLGNESRFINGVRSEQNNMSSVNCVAKGELPSVTPIVTMTEPHLDVVVGGKGRIVISTSKSPY